MILDIYKESFKTQPVSMEYIPGVYIIDVSSYTDDGDFHRYIEFIRDIMILTLRILSWLDLGSLT